MNLLTYSTTALLAERAPTDAESESIQPEPAPSQPWLKEGDAEAFLQGRNYRAYENLGAHLCVEEGVAGVHFVVWAPNAKLVQVIGDFNSWSKDGQAINLKSQSGLWHGFVPGVKQGMRYKYHVLSNCRNYAGDKADPFAFHTEVPPHSASIVWDLKYEWNDNDWLGQRPRRDAASAPVSIYEVHLGSWRRMAKEGNRSLSYRELAPQLADYAVRMGFTHVELMPITEHPFYGSWGYQTTGYFAPTSRYGTPQDFMQLVDVLHQHGIGVILDWVPSHFPADGHGLVYFDGTHLFEHADPRKGYHPDWNSAIFNYGRNEVRSFLISSALFWIEKYHIDGLRLDAVASMLYLDYSRKPGGWIPNRHGGRENLEAVDFLRELNRAITEFHSDVLTIAEESTTWPKVSRPEKDGGLGFGMKWDMGWMHDTLRYMKRVPTQRKQHHGELAFRMVYAYRENYVLSLSHDEVVHGKGSLYGMMTGDELQKYANLRLLYGYMFGQPGKKLLFMGDELAQWPEWSHESSVEWQLEHLPSHSGVQKWVADLNRAYRAEPALHELDFSPDGFEWIDYQDAQNSTLSFIRKAHASREFVLTVCNFAPVLRRNYRVGVPRGGFWKEILNSDAKEYGGSGQGNWGGLHAETIRWQHRPCSLSLTLPPLAALFFVSSEMSFPMTIPNIMNELPEYIDGLPNLCGSEKQLDSVMQANRGQPIYLPECRIDFGRIKSGFASALHMHQPLIPAGGADLATAEIISNLKYMMDNPGIGDNHNASVFHWCYKRMGEFIPQLVDEGKEPRVMLEYSGTLLHGMRQMGLNDVFDSLKRITCNHRYRRAVEWLGCPWGHAVAPSTPVQDFRLHVKAWQHHFAAIFGWEALQRVRGFSPSEMALPNQPDTAYEFVKTLKDCGYDWVFVQEHTVERPENGRSPERKHLPHRLVCRNSRGEEASIIAIIKTQGSDTKLVAQMQPYYEAKGLSRWELAGKHIPPIVSQIADGENGGVMMNEFPSKYMEVMRECSGSETPAVNASEYLEYLATIGLREKDFPVVQPLFQKQIWDRFQPGGGPEKLAGVIEQLKKSDHRFHMEGGSWTSSISWVRGYEQLLGPMERASSHFHEKVIKPAIPTHEPRYRNALFHLLCTQTSCYRYWGSGIWTDYGRELCRRLEAILAHDF